MGNSYFEGYNSRYSDIVTTAGILLIVAMLLLPLPAVLIDIFLVINIGISLIALLATIYVKDSVQLSMFPSLLLVFTLFRLALNVACCRAILLRGELSANIIKAFGGFVVGNNYVVGFIIFIILVLIQYIVISNGSQRVAEVAARFTLDAMPGKQMAIDADLNSGLINEEDARARRIQIEKEADFYGAMDGATKFVRGDAIAAIIITVVNIIGGFIIGFLQQKMNIIQALQVYTLLTIGAGIAMQVSALLLSTATGILVSRSATESDLGKDLVKQLLSQPKVILITAVLLFSFALVPAIPKIPFLLIASSVAGIAYTLRRTNLKEEQEFKKQQEKDALFKKKPENTLEILKMDALELEVGYGLIPLVNPEQGGSLLDRITLIRKQIALDLGIVVPSIRIRDNIRLAPNDYALKIKGVEVARKSIQLNQYLAINPGKVTTIIEGVPTYEPVFNLPALWISETQKRQAEIAGYTVVDSLSIVATHLSEFIRGHASVLLSRQDVQALIDNIKKTHPAVVDELIPNLLSIGEIQKVLQALLNERVSIRDLVTILEVLADNARLTKDIDNLVSFSRVALCSQICRQLQAEDKSINVVTLDPQVEQLILDTLKAQEKAPYLSIEPDTVKRIFDNLSTAIEKLLTKSLPAVILVSPLVRTAFRKLTERNFLQLHVLAYNEIPRDQQIKSQGVVTL